MAKKKIWEFPENTNPQPDLVFLVDENFTTQKLSLSGLTGSEYFSKFLAPVSSGSYNSSTGCILFTTTSGATFNVCGFNSDVITGGTFLNNILTLNKNIGSVSITGFDVMTGLTVNGTVDVNGNLSATTYYGNGTNLLGVINNASFDTNTNTITLVRNGGNISITGITDGYVTGFTYGNNNITLTQNEGLQPFTVNISVMTGLTINGNLTLRGNFSLTGDTNQLGDNTIKGDLSVNGTTTLSGVTNQIGSLNITGNTTQIGNVTQIGNSSIKGNLNLTGNTTQIGNFNLTGDTNIIGNTIQLGNNTINGNLNVNGTTTLSGTTNQIGNFNLTGNTNIVGNTTQLGNTILNGNLNVNGNTTLSGVTNQIGNFNLTGSTAFNGNFTIQNANGTNTGINVFDTSLIPAGQVVVHQFQAEGGIIAHLGDLASGEPNSKGYLYMQDNNIPTPCASRLVYYKISGVTTTISQYLNLFTTGNTYNKLVYNYPPATGSSVTYLKYNISISLSVNGGSRPVNVQLRKNNMPVPINMTITSAGTGQPVSNNLSGIVAASNNDFFEVFVNVPNSDVETVVVSDLSLSLFT